MTLKKCKNGVGCRCIRTIDQQIKYYGKQAVTKDFDEPLVTYVDDIKLDSDNLKSKYLSALNKYNSYLIMEKSMKGFKPFESNIIGSVAVMYAAEILGKLGMGTIANDLSTYAEPALRKKLWSDRLLKVSSAKGQLSKNDDKHERDTLVIEGMRAVLIETNDKKIKLKFMLQQLEKNNVLSSSYHDDKFTYSDKNNNTFSERTLRRIFNLVKLTHSNN